MIHIFIAEDHAIVREGLKQLFATTDDIVVVGEASNGKEVPSLVQNSDLDLLLLDLGMPGAVGTEVIARVRALVPKLPILVLSMYNEPQTVQRALRAGANGYLSKDAHPELLLEAIRKVAAGGKYVEPALAQAMVFEYHVPMERPPHDSLSDREFSISANTVSTYKARLMQKLDIDSNAALIRYAISHHLV